MPRRFVTALIVVAAACGPQPSPGARQPDPAPHSAPNPTPDPTPDSTTDGDGVDSGPAPHRQPTVVAPPVDDPGVPAIDTALLLDAPPRFHHLTLRTAIRGRDEVERFRELVYEGNNKNFRGELRGEAPGLYRSGDETARAWRTWAAGVRGLVVLRDSLFSQQDHPVLQQPRALMVPPNWVTVAVAETLEGRPLRAPIAPAIDDDAAWAEPESASAMFGSFPASDRLFTESRRSLAEPDLDGDDARRIRNARTSVQMLAAAARAMVDGAEHGPEHVAAIGAEWIAASDRSYFGAELRARAIIPIFVENPNEHELRDEGKGLTVWGRELPEAAVELTRRAVYGRRLRDGALAIERYDLRERDERVRAIAVLEQLVPRGSSGHPVWLWVNGGTDGHGRGDSGLPYIPEFRTALEAADIELARVVLLDKPSVRPRGDGAKAELERAATRHRDLGLPLSVQLNTGQAKRLFE